MIFFYFVFFPQNSGNDADSETSRDSFCAGRCRRIRRRRKRKTRRERNQRRKRSRRESDSRDSETETVPVKKPCMRTLGENELPRLSMQVGGGIQPSRRAVSEPPTHLSITERASSEAAPQPPDPTVQPQQDGETNQAGLENESEDSGIEDQHNSSTNENSEEEIDYFQVTGPTDSRDFLGGHLVESTFSVFQLVGPDEVSVLDLIQQLTATLRNMIQEGFRDVQPDDAVMVTIFCLQNMGNPITIPLTRFKHFKVEHITAAMEAAKISGRLEFKLCEGIQFTLKHVKNPSPSSFAPIRGGRTPYIFSNVESSIADRRCLVKIVNPDDQMCMARSIAVALAYNDYEKIKKENLNSAQKDVTKETNARLQYTLIRHPKRTQVQTNKALEFTEKIGVTKDTKCGPEEAKKFENALKIYIKIVGSDIFDQFAYNGWQANVRENVPMVAENTVYLLRYYVFNETGEKELHYSPILEIATYLKRKHYCHFCDYAYDNPYGHKCDDIRKWCYACYGRECTLKENEQGTGEKCDVCEARFRSDSCREEHKKMECVKSFYCIRCRKAFKRLKKKTDGGKRAYLTNSECLKQHTCLKTCPVCKMETPAGEMHNCFIQKTEFKQPSKKLIFLDFETDQSKKEHIPVFCHIKYYDCEDNGWKDKTFGLNSEQPNIKEAVGRFLFRKEFKDFTIIAHNMRAFDGCFLLQYLAENNLKPTPIFSGQKITTMWIPGLKIRIVDSLNFLPMPLAQFPKAFGFEDEAVKGFFPHFFTKTENFNYVGEVPSPEAYGVKMMNSKTQKEFLSWHQARKNDPHDKFNFKEEMEMYCKQDVEILMKGCLAFRNKILEMTEDGCDPFRYVTLASVAAAIFRSLFLKEKQIAAVPPNGYSSHQRFSCKSLEWLEYLRQECGEERLSHIANSPYGECVIGQYRFDGVDQEKKTAFEFNGCYYHGCPKCNKNKMDDTNPTIGLTFRALHERTMKKEDYVKNILKWNLKTMWECEWESLKKENEEIAQFVHSNQKIFTPMSPFDAFSGGRVEPFKLLIEGQDIKLCYVDFTSLYPFINATKKYPVGHPLIILSGFGSLIDICDRFFGLIKCDVLPPRGLYIPVLPGKYGKDKKLIFTLCARCAAERTPNSRCTHSNEERTLTGTWFTEELKLAVEMGYTIQKVYGVYHFEETTNELFSDYIKLFYKMKTLASGRPTDCQTDEQLHEYIQQVKEKEGIDLNPQEFALNPPIRQISKLLINSLWGRFGLRRNQPSHKFVTTPHEIFEVLEEPQNEITNLVPLHKDMVLLGYKKIGADFLDINNDANIYIAALTTAYARIELYRKMHLVKERVVYCDTDSIVYIHKEGEDLETGPFLGELTNELSPGDYISRFVAGGPKNYAYETEQGQKCVKVKGFTMSATNAKVFTFDNIKNILMSRPLRQDIDEEQEDDDAEELQDDLVFRSKEKTSTLDILSAKEKAKKQVEWRDEAFQRFHADNTETASAGVGQNYISTFNPSKIVRDKKWHLLSKPEQKLYSIMYDKRVVLSNFDSLPYGF